MSKKRVCIIGSGNWGSAIAKILGNNVRDKPGEFETTINMYMYEEMVNGRKLTEIVNTEHENVKYLPGIKLPENVIAIPDVVEAVVGADILIFVLPHQFVKKICQQIRGKVNEHTVGVSLIKGFHLTGEGISLISKMISQELGITCAVVMGANLAQEVAEEQFCETTIGCCDNQTGMMLRGLFETDYFLCAVVEDVATVEVCGALKNVVAIGSGIVDGLGFGDNTKAAVLRLGLMEMIKFAEIFFPGCHKSTFFESCGIADLVATCRGGRNRKLGEAVVKSNKDILELEEEILKGQSFQGPLIAHEVNTMLKSKDMVDKFPLFDAINSICERELDPREFINCLKSQSRSHMT